MKKLLSKIAVIILGTVLFTGMCSSLVCYANVKEDNTFVVGFDAEFPPYGYKDDNGEYVGFDLDLAQEVCNRKGWILKKQPIEWNSKDMELKTGAIDCIWNGFTMNGREKDYTWSTPYVDNSQVVIVKDSSKISKLTDLSGKIVTVQADSSALAALTGEDASEENKALAKSFKQLQQVGDYNSAFLNLDSGAVDAVCMDIGVAKYELKSRGSGFKMLDQHLSTEKYGIGFKLGNTELRDEVQSTLIEMLNDGTFAKIAENWGLDEAVCLSASDKVTDEDSSQTEQATQTSKQQGFASKILDISKQLAEGLLTSLAIFVLTIIFSMPLGLLVAAGRMSRFAPLRGFIKLYISIVRGTPLMLQLLVVFFGPHFLFQFLGQFFPYFLHVSTPPGYRFVAVIIGFSVNYAAYFAEIYRSGIQAIPKGQYEASEVLGYSRMQTNIKIVLPQMIKNIIPSITNEVITLVKDTSLAFALSYTEMFTLAKQISAAQATMMPLFIAGVFYYIFNFVVAFIMDHIEKKLNYYR